MIRYPLNVTIDTNIFESNKFDFSKDSTMRLLVKHVKNGKIKLVLSNIVISEVEKHIYQRVDDVCGKARKLRKEYLDLLPEQYLADIGMGVYVQIPDKKSIHETAKNVFEQFLTDCEVERLDTCSINLEDIIADYFAVRPPFENSEKKRKEFPDAFIAEEIRKRFGDKEIVAIVSEDKGLKKACTSSKNHLFFSSLGELFNTMTKNDQDQENYAVESLKKYCQDILQAIDELIDDDCVEVCGVEYDSDGVADGYEYDETYVKKHYLSTIKLHTIDDIDGEVITLSLWVHGNISVDCYFDDFENAPWDSEEKEYFDVKTRHILEEHNPTFACRIELNGKNGAIRVLPFSIVLGGDSRKGRIEIADEQYDLYSELEDSDREEFGFLPLAQYADMLEECLSDSEMAQSILEQFKEVNDIYGAYDDLITIYDDVLEIIGGKKSAKLVSDLASIIGNATEDSAVALEEITSWLNEKLDNVSDRTNKSLPDCIGYGESIRIEGKKERIYTLSLDELHGIPEAGSEEIIDITIESDEKILAKGYVKLTVGYLNFDDDGGASDGIEDDVDYEATEIIDTLKQIVGELKEELATEQTLAKVIKECLTTDTAEGKKIF